MLFSLSSQVARGSSFGMPAAAPPLILGQGSLLQGTMPGSPALSHAKAQSLGSAPGSPLFRSLSPCHPPLHGSPARATDISLSNVHVPLEAIRPSKGMRKGGRLKMKARSGIMSNSLAHWIVCVCLFLIGCALSLFLR